MTLQFHDYDGPVGFYVATGEKILPLGSPAGAIAFVGGAVQAGIGDRHDADVVQAMVDAASADAAAHAA